MMDAATPRPDLDTMRRELEEARHAMRAAIEARDVPEIECVFLRAHQILTDAQVLELRYKREKNIESQRRYWEIALGVERLRGQWLTDTEKKGLRYIRPKNTKFGAPTGLIRLDAAGQPPRIGIERKKSQDLQAFARLTEQQFQAVLADKTKMLTVAGILRLYAPKSTGDGANPGGGEKRTVSLDVIRADERAQPRAALDEDQVSEYVEAMVPDADAEDESLLHSLDTPDPDSLPRVSVEALQEKRKLVIEGMKADRACLAARPAPKPVEPAADLNQPAVHNDVDAPTTSQNLSAALKHAGAGFAVFLCDQHKKPRGKWRDISTTDPETIRLWFQTWPDSIVGIDLAKSGLIVVDADRHDPEHDGVDALGRLESENEPFENDSSLRAGASARYSANGLRLTARSSKHSGPALSLRCRTGSPPSSRRGRRRSNHPITSCPSNRGTPRKRYRTSPVPHQGLHRPQPRARKSVLRSRCKAMQPNLPPHSPATATIA